MQKKPKIYVDTRELRSHVATELDKLGTEIIFRGCEVSDYVLSDRCAAERKASEDFLRTLIERRELFSQLHDLAKSYERPLLIIEGLTDEIFTLRRIHPHAVQGTLNTIAVSFRIPILYTLNPAETAQVLYMIAKNEQDDSPGYFQPHGKRSHLSPSEQLVYTLGSLPDIGPMISKNLLNHFGSLQAVCNAEQEELLQVPLVGDVNSMKIKEFFTREYRGQNGT